MPKITGSGRAGNRPHHRIQEQLDQDLRQAKYLAASMDAVFNAMFPNQNTVEESSDGDWISRNQDSNTRLESDES